MYIETNARPLCDKSALSAHMYQKIQLTNIMRKQNAEDNEMVDWVMAINWSIARRKLLKYKRLNHNCFQIHGCTKYWPLFFFFFFFLCVCVCV